MAEDEKYIYHAKGKQKKATVAVLIIHKINLSTKCIPKVRFHNDKTHLIRKTKLS